MTSSQPVTTPNALNFTPDNKRAFAYSGNVEAKTDSQTVLTFQTNSEYIFGEFTFNGFIQVDNVSIRQGAITINNVIVANQITGDANEDMIAYVKQKIIIPPFSEVTCAVIASSGDSDNFATVLFTGDVYGMTEVGYQ